MSHLDQRDCNHIISIRCCEKFTITTDVYIPNQNLNQGIPMLAKRSRSHFYRRHKIFEGVGGIDGKMAAGTVDMSTRILQVLQQFGALQTSEICRQVKSKKKELNQNLYALQRKGMVQKLNDVPPTWSLVGAGTSCGGDNTPTGMHPANTNISAPMNMTMKTEPANEMKCGSDDDDDDEEEEDGMMNNMVTEDDAESGSSSQQMDHVQTGMSRITMAGQPARLAPFQPAQMPAEPANAEDLQTKLIQALSTSPNQSQTSQKLARIVGCATKKEINPTLYQMARDGVITRVTESPPVWKLRGNAAPPPQHVGGPNQMSFGAGKPQPNSMVSQNSSGFSGFGYFGNSMNLAPLGMMPVQQPQPQPPKLPVQMGSIPPPSSALNSDSFAALSKNPISAFMEHAQSRRLPASIEEIGQYGPPHDPRFYIAAKMGDRVFAHVEAKNKKTGRREAADKALRILVAEGAYEIKTEPSKVDQAAQLGQKATHFDKMATLAHHTYNTLVALMPDSLSGRKVLAAMIMKKSEEDDGIVIALGTGNRCIGGDCLSSNGETVNDSHAEIITRRGFIRYIYQNLLDHEPGSAESLFMKSTGGSKLRLRDGITFHLYISVAPCGDAALMTPREVTHGASEEGDQQHHPVYTSKAQGVLRTKIERGEGAVLIEDGFGGQTWDGILRGERLLTMSCSDKICRWNMLGLQGALLSHFVMPIYLSSLTLGYLYDHGHLSRAVCCRLQHTDTGILQRLPAGYQVTHPRLGRVTICNPPRETEKTKNVSLNWCVGDALPEITDGTQGQCVSGDSFIPENKPSQLSKRNLMTHFKGVCEKYGQHQIYEKKTYFQMKETSTDYQMAKAVLFQTFQNNGFGKWVKKPQEEELFV